MKILQLIGSTGLYGAEKWILGLMRCLDGASLRSVLLNLRDEPGTASAVVAAAVRSGCQAEDFDTGGRFNPLAALRLGAYVRRNAIDVIHGHGFKSDLLGVFASRVAGVTMISTPHGWEVGGSVKLRVYQGVNRRLFRHMACVCPLSEELAADVASLVPPGRMRLIRNGVDLVELNAAPPAERMAPGAVLVGYVGRLAAGKDIGTLLKAIALLAAQRPVALTIVGEGPERARLESESRALNLSGIVGFHGYREDAASLMKTFDALVLPSLSEGIPRCLMEAMGAGIPVVASDIDGNRRLVRDGETGLLFPPGDAPALAESLVRLFRDNAARSTMALRAKAMIESEYSMQRVADEYALLYRNLAGEGGWT